MTSETWVWEPALWEMARLGGSADGGRRGLDEGKGAADLAGAYALAETITRRHSRSFHLASALLPKTTKRSIRALYAYCRFTDDIVDGIRDQRAAEALSIWRSGEVHELGTQAVQIMAAWRDTQARYGIPQGYADQLIDGVRMDLMHRRYRTFEGLATYAYRVASTVGLMSMHILGFKGPEAVPYAVKMGVALQLTNILRDIGEDWRMGRLYLPLEELEAFGISERDIDEGRVTSAWRAYMRFAIERNRQLYVQAWPGLDLLSAAGRRSVGAAAVLYGGILDAIEGLDYDVFHQRAHLTRRRKMQRLASVVAPSLLGMPVEALAKAVPARDPSHTSGDVSHRRSLVSRTSSSA